MPLYTYYPHNSAAEDRELEKKIFRHSLLLPAIFTGLFWMVKLIEITLNLSFVKGGVYPLHLKGIHGILISPFIHSGFSHLISNSLPFFILLFALIYFYRRISYRIFWQIYLLSGICVWVFGREAWHIGASGVVYGLAAFHFVSGVIRNDVRLLTISVVVVFLYGGMIWGMFPINPDVSWESHLWGAISGVVLALVYRNYTIRRKPFDWENEPEDDEDPAMDEVTGSESGQQVSSPESSGENQEETSASSTTSRLDLPEFHTSTSGFRGKTFPDPPEESKNKNESAPG